MVGRLLWDLSVVRRLLWDLSVVGDQMVAEATGKTVFWTAAGGWREREAVEGMIARTAPVELRTEVMNGMVLPNSSEVSSCTRMFRPPSAASPLVGW